MININVLVCRSYLIMRYVNVVLEYSSKILPAVSPIRWITTTPEARLNEWGTVCSFARPHDAYCGQNPATLPDTSYDRTASAPRVSLGYDPCGLNACVWHEGGGSLWQRRKHKLKLVYYRVCQ